MDKLGSSEIGLQLERFCWLPGLWIRILVTVQFSVFEEMCRVQLQHHNTEKDSDFITQMQQKSFLGFDGRFDVVGGGVIQSIEHQRCLK